MARSPQIWVRMSKLLSQKGWRRTAIINVVLACMCDLTLLVCLLVSISQPGASFGRSSIIFQGSCITSSRLSLFFHLLINAISTAVLSSSNFFMQILNAPSRQEINNAHIWLQALDIGIPSIRNLLHVSRLKLASWLIFLITSIPIHLLFNSSIFETTYEGSQWNLTLATEKFTQGAPFFLPGASLCPAGSIGPYGFQEVWPGDGGGYGEYIPVDEYWNSTSAARQRIAYVAEHSHSWTVLNATQCYSEYVSCNPRSKYGDVVLILDSAASKGGWKRSDIFTFDPSTNLSEMWDPLVPPNAINSLWFSTQCYISRFKSSTGQDRCQNSCLGAMGLGESEFPLNTTWVAQNPWIITFFPAVRYGSDSLFPKGLEFNHKFDSFHVDHCLAQQIQPICKVGLSNALLLLVILSIFVKIIQGGVVAWKLPSASLVTPGDAIESFILYPDSVTQGLGTLDIADAQEIEFGERRHWSDTLHPRLTTKVQPRRWKKYLRRFKSIIPYTAWAKTYSIFIPGVALLTVGFAAASWATSDNYSGSLDHSDGVLTVDIWNGSPPGYIATLLFANTPQLILSLCYFSYNSLLTQIHVEKEWNAFSVSYQPLRVSYPSGQQISSYRLQLPYRHSVPLIIISIGLHWLVSNALFLYVNEGGYWDSSRGLNGFFDAFSVSKGSLIVIGYSPLFLLILFIAGFLCVIFPPAILSLYKIKGNMVAGGWNSLVISAACHIPNMHNNQDEHSFNTTDRYLREYVESSPEDRTEVFVGREEDEESFNKLLDSTQRKLRWGAMELPRKMVESVPGGERATFHLGFGGEEHDVSEPKDGEYYI